jgi:hypothetical protein
MEQGKAVEIQDQEKKFRRRRKKTTKNKVLDRKHATQDRLGFSTSYFSLHGPATRKGAMLLQFLQRCASGGRLVEIHCRRRRDRDELARVFAGAEKMRNAWRLESFFTIGGLQKGSPKLI